jgi:hypothetical protein
MIVLHDHQRAEGDAAPEGKLKNALKKRKACKSKVEKAIKLAEKLNVKAGKLAAKAEMLTKDLSPKKAKKVGQQKKKLEKEVAKLEKMNCKIGRVQVENAIVSREQNTTLTAIDVASMDDQDAPPAIDATPIDVTPMNDTPMNDQDAPPIYQELRQAVGEPSPIVPQTFSCHVCTFEQELVDICILCNTPFPSVAETPRTVFDADALTPLQGTEALAETGVVAREEEAARIADPNVEEAARETARVFGELEFAEHEQEAEAIRHAEAGVPPPLPSAPVAWEQEINTLNDMGFANVVALTALLEKHQGNLDLVIGELLQ